MNSICKATLFLFNLNYYLQIFTNNTGDMQTILGAGGAIATPLAKELFQYTNKIRLVSRNPKQVNPTDEILAADLSSRNQVFKAVEGSKVVYVVIGFPYKTKVWQQLWPAFIHNVVSACIFYKAKLVFFDNMYMYAPDEVSHMTESSRVAPSSQKGKVREKVANKVTAEFKSSKIDALIARAPDFLSIHNGVIAQTIYLNLKKGKSAMCLGSANYKRNIILPSIAAKAVALLGNTPNAYNQVWHLPSSHEALNGKEWTTRFAQELNCNPKHVVIPPVLVSLLGIFMPIMKEFKEMLYQYTQDYYFDSSKFEKEFKITHPNIEESIKEMIKEDF